MILLFETILISVLQKIIFNLFRSIWDHPHFLYSLCFPVLVFYIVFSVLWYGLLLFSHSDVSLFSNHEFGFPFGIFLFVFINFVYNENSPSLLFVIPASCRGNKNNSPILTKLNMNYVLKILYKGSLFGLDQIKHGLHRQSLIG